MRKLITPLVRPGSWSGRWPVLALVVASLLMTFGLVFIAAIDSRALLGHLSQLGEPGLTAEMRTRLDLEIAAETIKLLLDIYLLAVILAIFAPGLYTFFVKKNGIGMAQGLDFATRLFLTSSLGGLRNWLIAVVLLRLVVRFFQRVLRLEHEDTADLAYLVVVMALVVGALYLSYRQGAVKH